MRRNKGFTLIELLVVITIIAVLAAILFPVFLMARAKARQMACLTNLKSFGTTFSMYIGDYDSKFPYTSFPTGTAMTTGSDCVGMSPSPGTPFYNNGLETWIQKLEPYVKYQLVIGGGAVVGGSQGKPQGIMRCKDVERSWKVVAPGTVFGTPDYAGYGYNFLYLGLPFKPYVDPGALDSAQYNPYASNTNGAFQMGAPKQGSLASPAETLLLVENATIWAFPPCKGPSDNSVWRAGQGNQYIRPRHNGKSDVLYCDGHVTSIETKFLIADQVPFGDKGLKDRGVATNNTMWDTK